MLTFVHQIQSGFCHAAVCGSSCLSSKKLTPKIREVSRSATKCRHHPPPKKKRQSVGPASFNSMMETTNYWDFLFLRCFSFALRFNFFVARKNKTKSYKSSPLLASSRKGLPQRYDTARDGFSGSDPHRESVAERRGRKDVFEWHMGVSNQFEWHCIWMTYWNVFYVGFCRI